MRSYKLYAVLVTIACIALQGVNCRKNPAEISEPAEESDEYYETYETLDDEYDADAVQDYPEQDCGEYESEIWEDAFSNPPTMQLAKIIFDTAVVMGADEVCSDTVRTVMNYVHVMSTDTNAHYAMGMFFKLIKTMAKMVTENESSRAGENRKLMLRMRKSPEIQNLIAKSINRTAELIENPENRVRLVKMAKALRRILEPSENEKLVKDQMRRIKGAIVNPFGTTKGAMKKLGSYLK